VLHDREAMRRASGNPNGSLTLPRTSDVEGVADPKEVLKQALLTASELTGRRREKKKGEFPRMRARTAELIADFGPLAAVPAFGAFLKALKEAAARLNVGGALRKMRADDEPTDACKARGDGAVAAGDAGRGPRGGRAGGRRGRGW
jgi:hypothetical protein